MKNLPVPITLDRFSNKIVYLDIDTGIIIDIDKGLFEDATLINPKTLMAKVKIDGIYYAIEFIKDVGNLNWTFNIIYKEE